MVPTTTVGSGSTLFAGAVLPSDVAEHCEKHNLFGLLELAIQIANETFTLAGPIEVEMEIDYDGDEHRPILNVPVATTVEETQKQYYAFTREWIDRVPIESSLKIGMFPNIVEHSNETS